MLIVSKFYDYYDSCSSMGVDKSVVYQRQTFLSSIKTPEELNIPFMESLKSKIRGEYFNYTVKKVIVGFCGDLYPAIKIDKYNLQKEKLDSQSFYNVEDLYGYIDSEKIVVKESRYSYYGNRASLGSKKTIIEFFNKNNWNKLNVFFRSQNIPVFVFGRGLDDLKGDYEILIEGNPKLNDYKFMKIKDPYTAYQEIYMFISGFLGVPDRPTVKISDKDMASSKGHDSPYSFKKPPGGGRWR